MTTQNRTCRWCGHRVCHGYGYLNSAGAGDPCGAAHCLSGGLCPACAAPAEAREVIDSEQTQPGRSR